MGTARIKAANIRCSWAAIHTARRLPTAGSSRYSPGGVGPWAQTVPTPTSSNNAASENVMYNFRVRMTHILLPD